jgi:hypothetical protein
MTVSIDGLRRNIAKSFKDVHNALCDESPTYPDCYEIKDAMIRLRSTIGASMCVYSENPADLLTDMADKIDTLLPSFEQIEQGEK